MIVTSNSAIRLAAIVTCVAAAGCSSVQPFRYAGLQSSSYLAANIRDDSHKVPYRFADQVEWSRYRSIIIDPVTIYSGSDNQFASLSEQDKSALASYMQSAFTSRLQQRFSLVAAPAPDTLRLRLTLSGATTNTPLISPFTHFDMGGNALNLVQAARGREGVVAGSVSYAVEVHDALSNRLLLAYVTKQYPGAMNISASFGSLSASKVGIDKGADMLADELR